MRTLDLRHAGKDQGSKRSSAAAALNENVHEAGRRNGATGLSTEPVYPKQSNSLANLQQKQTRLTQIQVRQEMRAKYTQRLEESLERMESIRSSIESMELENHDDEIDLDANDPLSGSPFISQDYSIQKMKIVEGTRSRSSDSQSSEIETPQKVNQEFDYKNKENTSFADNQGSSNG